MEDFDQKFITFLFICQISKIFDIFVFETHNNYQYSTGTYNFSINNNIEILIYNYLKFVIFNT